MSGKEARFTSRESVHELRRENQALRERLDEVNATLRALRAGEVDAVVIEADREQIFTLETPDTSYRLLVEQMPHAAVTLTTEGAIIHANRRFADLVSRPRRSLVGTPFQDWVRAESREAIATLLRGGRAAETHAEIDLQRDDGTSVTVYLGASPLQEGAYGSCLLVTDLTTQRHYEELRRTQEALRESEAQLREADRRKDEFLAVLAHELRNPLVPMRNAVELLKANGPLPPELEWSRGVIDRQVRLMARLLDDLLDVARIVRNTLELRYERVALGTVLDAALETSRPLIEAGRHEFVLSIPSEPLYLRADPARLSQVFGNILNNAAKYTDPGGRIEVVARREGAQVVVSVKDSGMGITPEVLPKVFDIFTQAQQAIDRAQGGLGVGLSLVKRLTEMHGGTVEARSDGEGRGSEFVVRLPLDSAASTASP